MFLELISPKAKPKFSNLSVDEEKVAKEYINIINKRSSSELLRAGKGIFDYLQRPSSFVSSTGLKEKIVEVKKLIMNEIDRLHGLNDLEKESLGKMVFEKIVGENYNKLSVAAHRKIGGNRKYVNELILAE